MNRFIRWIHRITAPSAPQPSRRQALGIETLETRALLSTVFPSITGVGNNLANPTWGAAGTDLLRLSPATYADGISAPSLPNDPSARAISNIVNNQADPNNPSQDITPVHPTTLSPSPYPSAQSTNPTITPPPPN